MNNVLFGLREADLEAIIQVLASVANIEKGVIFGSRAKGKTNKVVM